MRTRQARIVLAVLLALGVTGCGDPQGEGVATAGGQGAGSQSAEPRPSQNPEERVRQFVACMREQGVDVPDPQPGDQTGKSALRFDEGGMDKATLSRAMESCNEYLPQGGDLVKLTPEQIERQRVFAQCMRDNGVPQWPDPDPETGGFRLGEGLSIDKDDAAVRAAMDTCRGAAGE